MGIISDKFRRTRLDQTPYLFHFTKGTKKEGKESLYSILNQEKLISKKDDFVCFSASPITSIHKFFETKVKSTNLPMYQPFGIGFSRDLLIKEYGARNVIYCNDQKIRSIFLALNELLFMYQTEIKKRICCKIFRLCPKVKQRNRVNEERYNYFSRCETKYIVKHYI